MRLIAEIFLEEFSKDPSADAIGGPTMGSVLALCQDSDMRGFIVRKSEKEYGTRRLIEGSLLKGDSVVLVEDVVTTGASVMRAAEAVRGMGASVSKIMAVVSRADTANPFEGEGIEFFNIFDVKDLTG